MTQSGYSVARLKSNFTRQSLLVILIVVINTAAARPSGTETRLYFLCIIAGPLPAELHAHHRTMLHIVNAILTEPTILTKVDGERAITNHDMNRSFDGS